MKLKMNIPVRMQNVWFWIGLIGTIQNMIGDRVLPAARTTPDTYELQSLFALMVAEGCDYCVMEVSSHALDQERVAGCTFDAAVFTNLTQAPRSVDTRQPHTPSSNYNDTFILTLLPACRQHRGIRSVWH